MGDSLKLFGISCAHKKPRVFILHSYPSADIFCIITMLCWGSWANVQKLSQKKWGFQLFYWDYTLGILILSVIGAFTLGSSGR